MGDNSNKQDSQLDLVTKEGCVTDLMKFINSEKKGLLRFYKDKAALETNKLGERAAEMIKKLREMGCGKEASKQLSILCLYDIVMLIDDSSSMADEEEGKRIETLRATMQEISKVYDLASPSVKRGKKTGPRGLLSVRFINSMTGYKNIDEQRVNHVVKKHTFWGTTQIGGALQKKVLDDFVFNTEMERPLLVMVITDGGPEGESRDTLQKVIDKCCEKLVKKAHLAGTNDVSEGLGESSSVDSESSGSSSGGSSNGNSPRKEKFNINSATPEQQNAKDAVAFHFSRVGNDKDAEVLLKTLDRKNGNVDYLRAEYALERLKKTDNEKAMEYKWNILPKLLLGAIVSSININDDEDEDEELETTTESEADNEDGDEEIELDEEDEEDGEGKEGE